MMMKSRMMKAAVLTGPRQVVVKEVAVPDVHPGEIELAVSSCGVCGCQRLARAML